MANKSTGVEVRFSVKDFEQVVAALRAGGDEGERFARRLEMAGRTGTRGLTAIDAAAAGVRDRARALSGELGVVGQVLQSIGPWGVAAGAGIAVAIIAFRQLVEFADRFAAKAQKIRDVSEATQNTTDTVQALREAGQDVSITADKVDAFIGRFSTGITELRRGEGELLKVINSVDPALAVQLARTRDMASAWNVLAQAYRNASDAQKLDLTKALAGQRNIGAGQILQMIADAGGVEKLAEIGKKSGEILDKEIIQRLAKIKIENDSLKGSIENTFGIFTAENTLLAQRTYLNNLKEMLDAARSFQASGDFKDLINSADSLLSNSWLYLAIKGAIRSASNAGSMQFTNSAGRVVNGKYVPNGIPDYTNDVPYGVRPSLPNTVPNPQARPAELDPALSPEFLLNRDRARAQILGPAQTRAAPSRTDAGSERGWSPARDCKPRNGRIRRADAARHGFDARTSRHRARGRNFIGSPHRIAKAARGRIYQVGRGNGCCRIERAARGRGNN
jgi:hypothetical protein